MTNSEAWTVTGSYFHAENRRDLAGILDHFHPDVTFRAPDGTVLHGHAEIRPFYAANVAALPALRVDLVDEVAAGDRAAIEWTAQGLDPNGEPVLMHGTNVVTVHDGRFWEFRAYWGSRAR